ncbi:unnamed protein product, partial [Ectocarpus fasciculatus]
MKGKGTDPSFGTSMGRTVVLTTAYRLQFPGGGAWGAPMGEEVKNNMCPRSGSGKYLRCR